MVNKKRLSKNFVKLLSINSPSGKENIIANYLKKELSVLGLSVKSDKAGNIIAKLLGEGEPFLLCAHMDTVEPTNNLKIIFKNGIFKSDGSTILGGDDKGGITIILEVLRIIKERKLRHPSLEIILTSQEEIGLIGSRHLDFSQIKSKNGIILDCSGRVGKVVKQAPGYIKLDVSIIGKSAHSGSCPEKGINALEVAVKCLSKIKLGRVDKDSTINFGIIKGGKAVNIVPDFVELKGEIRSFYTDKLERHLKKISLIFKKIVKQNHAKLNIKSSLEFKGFIFKENEYIVKMYKEACNKNRVKFSFEPHGGGSDANIINSQGIKTLNIGIGMMDPHSNKESLSLNSMIKSAEIILTILKKWI